MQVHAGRPKPVNHRNWPTDLAHIFPQAWLHGLNSGDASGAAYWATTIPLERPATVPARLSGAARRTLERQYATIEIADSVAMMGGHQVGALRGYHGQLQQAVQELEGDVTNGLLRNHEMTAILDKIAAGELLGRRQDMAANQLLSHALEQLLARSKRLTERTAARSRRRDEDRERRSQVALEFLADPRQRAMVHPLPTPKRCFLATAGGRLMFDVSTDVGPARELPPEAHRRFRADLRARKERNLKLRAEQLALHEEKKRVIAEWAATRATEDQRARFAAGVLPVEEAIEALTEEAFSALNGRPRYELDGATRLQTHLRALTGRADIVVAPADLRVVGLDASAASSGQWAVIRQLKTALPDADVTLREHRLSWRRDPAQPTLTVFGALVTRQVGPFILRREFAVRER